MRDEGHYEPDERVKQKNMGWREFAIAYGVMVLLVGIQTGLLVFPAFNGLNPIAQILIIMSYWAIVAFVFSLLTNWQIRQNYDKPMRRLGSAEKKWRGEISPYVWNRSIPPINTTILTSCFWTSIRWCRSWAASRR